MPYEILRLVVTELDQNCHLLWDAAGDAVVVDPGGDAGDILGELERRGLKLRVILNTHGHVDHVGANAGLHAATGAPVAIHPADAPMLGSELLCGAAWLGMEFEPHQPDVLLADGGAAGFGPMTFEVRHTPGHSPGSCILVDHAQGEVFSGDLVFRGSVGRWDLPGGNRDDLLRSLREKLVTLPPHYRIHPGHGESTTVGAEIVSNPYLQGMRD